MESTHTPGPWIIYHGSRSIYSNQELIATIRDLPSENDIASLKRIRECMANARLIATAPDLLQACKTALLDTEMLLSEECDFTPDNLQATIEVLRKAIAKATSKG